MNMNIIQIVVKTVVTTLNLLVLATVLIDRKNPESAKRIMTVLIAMNLMGVWI